MDIGSGKYARHGDFNLMGNLTAPTPDATTSSKGKLLLAGVLAGTASVPTFSITTGAWTAYTPTWTNVTIGNATVTASYFQIGKQVTATIAFTFGSTTSITGQIAFSLPVTAAARYTGSGVGQYIIGTCYMEDAGVSGYTGFFRANSTTTTTLTTAGTAGSFLNNNGANATTPFTWAVTGTPDFFSGTFIYEAA